MTAVGFLVIGLIIVVALFCIGVIVALKKYANWVETIEDNN